MKFKTLCLMVAAMALLAFGPAFAEETVAPTPATPEQAQQPAQDPADDACLDYSPVESTETPALLLGPADMEPVAPGCKTCKDQPFCKCTYNGMRRTSCDPCCYANDIGVLTCLS